MGVNGYKSGTPRRAYYPSGPWIDGIRPPEAVVSRDEPRTKPSPTKPEPPNPDPLNYRVEQAEQHGEYLLVKIHYPDCTNYEGNKILVFKGVTPIDLLKQRAIDPHFFQHKDVASPVARFVPTDEGWAMAWKFVKAMSMNRG